MLAAIDAGLATSPCFPSDTWKQRYIRRILPLAKARGVSSLATDLWCRSKLLGTAGYSQPLQAPPRGKLSSGGVDDAVAVLRLTVNGSACTLR
ncbi:MAG: hypothetical protein H6643_03810 [Caldilineaceae bacterium]|nr:hypothetical protein [Caldilineaceae bacterium]